MPRFIHITLAVILILFTIFVAGINVFAYVFMAKDGSLKTYFEDLHIEMQIERIPFNNSEIRYIHTGLKHDTSAVILFIHGAPGTSADFKSYLADYDLMQNFKLVSMDRLGYGSSDSGVSQTDISIQAKAAAQVIRSFNSSEVYVVSHSYGAPVSAKLAIDYPDIIDGVIMIAPLIDPDNEPMPWYVWIANTSYMKLLMPEFVNVATDEKMNHAESLQKIKSGWINLSTPVLHIHGKKDALAPFHENIEFSENNIRREYLVLDKQEKMGHLLIWMNAGHIKKKIIEFIQLVRNRNEK